MAFRHKVSGGFIAIGDKRKAGEKIFGKETVGLLKGGLNICSFTRAGTFMPDKDWNFVAVFCQRNNVRARGKGDELDLIVPAGRPSTTNDAMGRLQLVVGNAVRDIHEENRTDATLKALCRRTSQGQAKSSQKQSTDGNGKKLLDL